MAKDSDIIREPDGNSGPAILGREPVILPEKRKELSRKAQMKIMEMRE